MPAAPLPIDETSRVEELRSFAILDTPAAGSYDGIVARLARECDVPFAAISLVDAERQWFKAMIGFDARAAPRGASFCAHAILQAEPLVVEDAARDARFADNPLVTGAPRIRFYAGVPLVSNRGHRIGALCAVDTRPRALTRSQMRRLLWLAGRTMILLNIHKSIEQMGFAPSLRT